VSVGVVTLIEALLVLYGTHAAPANVAAIERAATEHHADLALVSAIAERESSSGTHGHYLTGAHLRLPVAVCLADAGYARRYHAARRARRPAPPCYNRDPAAQAGFTARLFGGVARRAWPRMLASYRCGPNAACQRDAGAAYAGRILAMRDELAARMRGR
jgi:hypothetical protein